MRLRLQFPSAPEFAAQHAEVAVSAVRNVKGLSLDYSPDSLQVIDRIIQGFRSEGLSEEQIAETVFSFGCYAGEVFVRNNEAEWVDPAQVLAADIARHFPFMVVQLPDGRSPVP